MKYLLIFLTLFLFAGCAHSVVEVPKESADEHTTLEIQQNIDTTLKVSKVGENIYLLTEDGKVHTKIEEGADSIIWLILLLVLLGMVIGALLEQR
jgi:cbb3-type cytochrome oxidase subunit 3